MILKDVNHVKRLFRPVIRRMPHRIKHGAYDVYRRFTARHQPDGSPNVLLFTMPRSGSTWLMELIWGQPGFKCVNEPFDMRLPIVRKELGLQSWTELQNDSNRPYIERYIRGYIENRVHAAEVAPHKNKFRRRRTTRIVFKIIHAGENQINWFKDTFDAKVVFMTRHPIAVALSHESFPRLEAYLNSDFSKHFTAAQLELAANVIKSGSHLQKGVLDWCFQNALPLRDRQDDWVVLSYEQLVLDPEPLLSCLADKLELPDKAKMYRQLSTASGVKRKSDRETQELLDEQDNQAKRLRLVSKWQDKVSNAEAWDAFQILELFGINAYRYGDLLPNWDLWVGDHYTGATALEEEMDISYSGL